MTGPWKHPPRPANTNRRPAFLARIRTYVYGALIILSLVIVAQIAVKAISQAAHDAVNHERIEM